MYFFVHLFSLILSVCDAEGDNDVVYPCTTPDNEMAYCISFFECPGLMKSLATLDTSSIEFLKQSICLGCEAGDFMVCCGKANLASASDKLAISSSTLPPLPTRPPKNESKRDKTLRTLIPDKRYCGLQHTDDRFYNDSATALDEFPWLVHIKFTDIYSDYKLGDRCTGVLLNNKYVLTDSTCASLALKVRLGQYNAIHKTTCLENPQAHECNEGTIEIRIEKKIDLLPSLSYFLSLTLIRLAKAVDYTDFVRPICLPFTEPNRVNSAESFIFSGWGAKPNQTILDDAIKKRLAYDTTGFEECAKYNTHLNKIIKNTTVSFSCFLPQARNKDIACPGDHGGPLMYSDAKHQWYVEHVVVEVMVAPFSKCAPRSPVLAVKITPEIIEAIVENIEP